MRIKFDRLIENLKDIILETKWFDFESSKLERPCYGKY